MRFLALLTFLFFINPSFSNEFLLDYHSIPKELLKDADAVVRLDKKEVSIESYKSMYVRFTRAVTVLNENGWQFVHAYSFYDNEQRIIDLEAVVFDSNGEEIEKFKEREFSDQSATGNGTLYSDSRVKFLRYTPTEYPFTLVFSGSYHTSDTAFVPSQNFLNGYRVSTEKSTYLLEINCDVAFRYKENNLEEFGVQSNKKAKRLYYYAEHLEAIDREPLSPYFRDFAPNVKIALETFHLKGVDGYARDWSEFGSWIYNSLLYGQDELDDLTKTKVRKAVWGVDDPKERIQRVYEFMQNNTRYISVQLGIGGWKPISAKEVDKVKYGDCKGLTNYTKALLKEVGIDSYYTVVYGDPQKRDLDPEFPALQGNHVFLNVPLENETIWLECTNQQIPANYLGTFTDDRYVLKVTPEGGELVKSKKYSEEESKQLTMASITIDGSGKIAAKVKISSTGIQYDQKYELVGQKLEQQEEHYKDYWKYVNNLQVKEIQLENDKNKIALHEEVEVITGDYISLAGDKWLFAPNMFNRNLYVPKRVRNRSREVVMHRGFVDEDNFTIKIPEGYKTEALLPKVDIKNDFGEYRISMELLPDGDILYKRKLVLNSGNYPKERYKEFRDFTKQIVRIDNSKIVITKI